MGVRCGSASQVSMSQTARFKMRCTAWCVHRPDSVPAHVVPGVDRTRWSLTKLTRVLLAGTGLLANTRMRAIVRRQEVQEATHDRASLPLIHVDPLVYLLLPGG